MKPVQKLVTQDSFDATGTFISAGHIGTFDADKLNGKEAHLHDVDLIGGTEAIVQIAPIAPTGPNPNQPQQLPPDAIQGPGGQYFTPGKRLVGEVTRSADVRLSEIEAQGEDHEAEVTEELSKVLDISRPATLGNAVVREGGAGSTTGNADDALVDGTVAEVTADLGGKTDEELTRLEAAENDREKPRTGVLKAIEAERASRLENATS